MHFLFCDPHKRGRVADALITSVHQRRHPSRAHLVEALAHFRVTPRTVTTAGAGSHSREDVMHGSKELQREVHEEQRGFVRIFSSLLMAVETNV